MNSKGESADEWARIASRLPLAFAQVREDPRLDLEIVDQLSKHPVIVMIASGGETAIQLAKHGPSQLHLVDMNPAQLALTQLKMHLAQHCGTQEAKALLGHQPLDATERIDQLMQVLQILNLPADIFGTIEDVGKWGPDFSGRYERTFCQLTNELAGISSEIQELLNHTGSVCEFPLLDRESPSGKIFDAAFETVMSLPNLVCLFGNQATQNPKQSFATHFAWRTRISLMRDDREENPFLWQMLTGCFPPRTPYDWLALDSNAQSLAEVKPILHCSRMVEVLQSLPTASVDLVHLSNILDWLSPSEASETLRCAERVLKAGGRVIVRQLNSTLQIPELESGLKWDSSFARQLADRDRSFFYPDIFVGERR